jgi:hypothetical protein
MKKSILSALFVGLLLLAACKKHSTFSGRVLSSDGMVPIEGAGVSLNFSIDKRERGTETVAQASYVTDSTGEYLVEVEAKNAHHGLLLAAKQGYAPIAPISFKPGKCDELDFILNPYDAWLSVTFENTKNTEQSYYHYYTGPFFKENYCFGSCGPTKIAPFGQQTFVALIPGGADTDVFWDYEYWGGKVPLRYKTTQSCPRHDTTYVHIKI